MSSEPNNKSKKMILTGRIKYVRFSRQRKNFDIIVGNCETMEFAMTRITTTAMMNTSYYNTTYL